ncbi:FAD-binding oxidoreductase [Halegenticoccus tardaugens]|uniref:FAD-binding oxidoreductase n=1 Tax=Halegenticoccus tardaugens TaxID=2071624 RepID=UPI0013E96F73|nr:FAD-binding oxidoreductase [Halegenticoccus tardaugens]
MRPDEHPSQREAAEELPLITESATVVEVEPMDHNRTGEVLDAVAEILDEHGGERWRRLEEADGDLAGDERARDALEAVAGEDDLAELLSAAAREDRVEKRLLALWDRFSRPYPSLLRVDVRTDERVAFLPGQYVSVRFGEASRPYSVASSPNRGGVEFCIRRVPGGRLTSTLSVDLSPGDEVTLRGPYGDFLMKEPSSRDLVFLATGTGVAPFKSMIDYLFEEGRDEYEGETRDVWLFLGVGWEDDLPYREAFRRLDDERENFHFVPTLSREEYLTDWDGETAYVQHALVKYLAEKAVATVEVGGEFEPYVGAEPRNRIDARLDPANVEVYACGINAMVNGLVDAVERLGVPADRTHYEGFG